MNKVPDPTGSAIDALRQRIEGLKQEIDEEYRRIGRNVPELIQRETKPVNRMIDELILLNRRLAVLEKRVGPKGE